MISNKPIVSILFPSESSYIQLIKVPYNRQETRPGWYTFVSHHFRHPDLGGGLRKRDVVAIEYYLRRGEKMLEAYSREGVKTVRPPDTQDWPMNWVAKGGKDRDRKAQE